MKRFLILSATFLSSIFLSGISLSSVSNAQAVECAPDMPANRKGHWSYRLIDGRKCWYEGKAMLPKSSLRWAVKSEPVAQAAPPPVAPAKVPATDGRDFSDPEDGSCCWPSAGADNSGADNSFESRWRSLGLKPAN